MACFRQRGPFAAAVVTGRVAVYKNPSRQFTVAMRPRTQCSVQRVAAAAACPFFFRAKHISSAKGHIGDRTTITSALWDLRVKENGDKLQVELVPKRRADSRVEIVYNFGTDKQQVLRSAYANPWGRMRIGKLLEDIDALAGTVANRHADDADPTTMAPSMVTASVDDVDFRSSLCLDTDIRMTGFVSWVGRSSMEICVELHQDKDGSGSNFQELVASATFTFVALDPISGRPCSVNPLAPQSEVEKADFDRGQARADEKRRNRQAGRQDDDDGRATAGPQSEKRMAELLKLGRNVAELPQSQPGYVRTRI
jgi:acyl-coenzyme A thioesterase 9